MRLESAKELKGILWPDKQNPPLRTTRIRKGIERLMMVILHLIV